jgi:two-component system, NarL family, sensor kinase
MSAQPTSVGADARSEDAAPWVRLVDGGRAHGRAARRPPPSARRVLGQFVLGNLAAVTLLLGGSVWASGKAAQAEALSDARTSTNVLATTLVQPALTDAALSGDADALAALDRAVTATLQHPSVVRVKIWDPTGRIVYSDESRLLDVTYSLGEDEKEALSSGDTLAEISDLDEPENRYERSLGVLLEVYRRIETPAGQPLLLETYQRYDDVAERQREILLTFAPISATVLLLRLLLQLPLGDRMVRQLREGEAERSGLQARAADASIDERRRIAGTLHDGIVQDLAAASYVLSGATDRLSAGDMTAEETAHLTGLLRTAEGTLRGSVAALRSLLIEIYPPHLARTGLPAALRGLGERLQPRDVRLRVDVPDVVEVPEETAALLFRVAQEALINVGRHARARTVQLTLTTAPDRVLLEVADDGVGFDPSEGAGKGHFGLRVLTDLAAAAGATLDLATAPGRGTALRLEVPLS